MPSNPVVHVIDDDDAARDSLAFLLRAAQVEVRTYETAPAFLATTKPVLPGCVITDVRMPGMTGIELLRRLRESGIDIPVIVITGHGDIPLAVEAMKYGAADFARQSKLLPPRLLVEKWAALVGLCAAIDFSSNQTVAC